MFKSKKEQRRYKRYKVGSIHGNILYSADFNIVNISLDGAAIETTKRLNIDREYTLKIKSKANILDLRGLVAWSILSHTETKKSGEVVPVYKAGVRFTNVQGGRSGDLLKFIDENKSKTIEKRMLGVRFKVKKADDTIIDHSDEYDIKRISLSGMLIETESLFEVDSHHEMKIYLDQRGLLVVGCVVNCVEYTIDNIDKYEIGIKFIKMSNEDRSFLKHFLDNVDREKNKD